MKNLFFIFLSLFVINFIAKADDLIVKMYDPPIPYNGTSNWGNDYVVSNSEPLGYPSGVYRQSNSTIYIAIPDTSIMANSSIAVLTSTNNGANWSVLTSVTPSNIVLQTKMLKTSTDEIYCFFLLGSTVHVWNVLTGIINQYTTYTNVREFDAATSSTGALYLIIDLNANNQVRFAGTTTGGASWVGAVFLSSAAARPKIYMSPGDTLLINYYGPIADIGDTNTAAIRNVRYRESSPGSLTIVGTFTTIVPAGTPKTELRGVLYGGKAWVFFTEGAPGSMDLKCMVSENNGTNYGASFSVGAMPERDEYWFDAKHYTFAGGGVDVIYYSDSSQTGPPTNNSDKMFYTSAPVSNPSTFITPESFSDHPPVWSERGYIPSLIEYYDNDGDVGAIWVGLDGSDRKLFFDRLNNLVNISNEIELVQEYYLNQNYPNPFNPTTKINFSIPKKEFVTLKIYNILGEEVSTLVNKEISQGIYSVEFNADNISSGVYFYKLTAGSFSQTRSMIVVK